jgi:hypothetical protein
MRSPLLGFHGQITKMYGLKRVAVPKTMRTVKTTDGVSFKAVDDQVRKEPL